MRAVMAAAMVGALGVYFTHLEVVPVSGRRRFNCFGEESMRLLGQLQYEALMEEAKEQGQRFLPDYDPRTVIVRHVMRRLIPVSGMADGEGEWEIRVIDDAKTANAFVLPGGKVFVFSGIFAIARSEDALAAVLGHELAHNLANHHGERASSAIGTTMLLTSAFLLTAGLAYFVLRPVVNVVFNSPMSRLQETEADYIGLMLMAEACYDPAQAADFWRRMEQAQQSEPPEWTSTHPSVRNHPPLPPLPFPPGLTIVPVLTGYRISTGSRRSRSGCQRLWKRGARAPVTAPRALLKSSSGLCGKAS